jgi:hypothetical protein
MIDWEDLAQRQIVGPPAEPDEMPRITLFLDNLAQAANYRRTVFLREVRTTYFHASTNWGITWDGMNDRSGMSAWRKARSFKHLQHVGGAPPKLGDRRSQRGSGPFCRRSPSVQFPFTANGMRIFGRGGSLRPIQVEPVLSNSVRTHSSSRVRRRVTGGRWIDWKKSPSSRANSRARVERLRHYDQLP